VSQPIKYASTTIDPGQSAGEIADLVRKYGGSRFEMRWGEFGRLEGIRFAIRDPEIGQVPVRLDAQADRVLQILREAKPYSRRMRRSRAQWEEDTEEQAYRIAWRQLRDFVEQALLAVETGLFPLASAFMAHVEVWDEEAGETVTMGELVGRRAEVGPGRDGLLLGPGRVR
jgi:hypothetical protein